MSRRLYLIRHGRPSATWNAGPGDPGLDAEGAVQALAARDALLALPASQRPAWVISSPLRRCRETALPTARALGVESEVDPRVGEIPTPAGIGDAARAPWLRRAFEGLWRDIPGELDYDAWRRQVAAALLARGGAAVFSHFVAINGAVSVSLGLDEVVAFRPDHASITVFETDGRRLTLIAKGREGSGGVL